MQSGSIRRKEGKKGGRERFLTHNYIGAGDGEEGRERGREKGEFEHGTL